MRARATTSATRRVVRGTARFCLWWGGYSPPDPGWKFLIGMELQAKVRCKILSRKGLATDSSQERTYEQFFVEGTGGCGWGVFVHVSILPEGAK